MNFTKLVPRSSAPHRDAEESVPLNSLDPEEDFYYPSPSPSSRARESKPTSLLRSVAWKRWVILCTASYLFIKTYTWLYSNPERWEKSLRDTLTGPRAVVVDEVVRAAGQKWRGLVDEVEEIIGFKGVRYAQSPIGERRFRRAVPVEVKERSEDEWEKLVPEDAFEWNEGCPRPENGVQGSEKHSGIEDCLK